MTDLHPCPRCGRPTSGAWSEGGLKWSICEDCMAEDREAAEREMEERRRQCPRCEPDVVMESIEE